MRNELAGFTLLELMIVVVVVSILAAVAYPAYTDSVLKGKRAQGRTALMELLQQQERYLTQRNCYLAFDTDDTGHATPLASCGSTPTEVPLKTISGDNLENAAYVLSAGQCPDPAGGPDLPLTDCVRAVARPRMPDPSVGSLVMTSTGSRTCTGERRNESRVCWP